MATIKSLAIIMLLLAVLSTNITSGTWALFNDDEASNADQIVSGTLDLKTDDEDGTSQTLDEKNLSLEPGESSGLGVVALKNAGSVVGSSLDISFSYIESDNITNDVDMSADETAAIFEVIVLTYDVTNLLASISDDNINGYIDLQDLAGTDLSGQSGLGAGATKDLSIEVITDNTTSTDFADDGVDITMAFTLNQ